MSLKLRLQSRSLSYDIEACLDAVLTELRYQVQAEMYSFEFDQLTDIEKMERRAGPWCVASLGARQILADAISDDRDRRRGHALTRDQISFGLR